MHNPQKSSLHPLSSPILVQDQQTFSQMMEHLSHQSPIAIDTESDSLYSYYPKVCLIQISALEDSTTESVTESATEPAIIDYLLDPIVFPRIERLNELLSDPEIEIIIHSAYNDILMLQRDYAFSFTNLFDTQLAARILGWKRSGLAAILEEHFGVVSDKRMQRTDWGRRPMSAKQIAYAQMDTHYLLALRHRQLKELEQMGRLEEAQEAFAQLELTNFRERPTAQRTFWSMKRTRDVQRENLGVLEALWEWREKEAQRQDRPPFKIMTDQVLVQLAARQPKSRNELRSISGLSQNQSYRYGRSLLRALEKGKRGPLPQTPEPRPRPEYLLDSATLSAFESLRRWRTDAATERGVDPDIVFSNETLMAIARHKPTTEEELQELREIGPWKARTYGAHILRILARNR